MDIEIAADSQSIEVLARMLTTMPLTRHHGATRAEATRARGISELVGDREHTLYFLRGFVDVEDTKREELSPGISLSFWTVLNGSVLLLEARLTPADGEGSVSYGLRVTRIGEDWYVVSNG